MKPGVVSLIFGFVTGMNLFCGLASLTKDEFGWAGVNIAIAGILAIVYWAD